MADKKIDFEKAFGDFLDRREYDETVNALFSMVRISFKGGWLAAGGRPPKAQKVFELHRRLSGENPEKIPPDEGPIATGIQIDDK